MSIVPQQLQYTTPTDDGDGGTTVGWMSAFLSMLQKNWFLLVQTLNKTVSGPNGVTSGDLASFADSTGLVLQDSGIAAAPQAWQALTPQNSWSIYGTADYYKDQFGRVWLRGGVTGGTNNFPLATLPTGYRPGVGLGFATWGNGQTGIVVVGTDGTITPESDLTYVGLNGITFDTRA